MAFALLLAGTSPTAPQQVPPPLVSAMLVPQPAGLTLSRSGVLVLPFELRNPGPALVVTETEDLVVDVGAVPGVRETVAGLCG